MSRLRQSRSLCVPRATAGRRECQLGQSAHQGNGVHRKDAAEAAAQSASGKPGSRNDFPNIPKKSLKIKEMRAGRTSPPDPAGTASSCSKNDWNPRFDLRGPVASGRSMAAPEADGVVGPAGLEPSTKRL